MLAAAHCVAAQIPASMIASTTRICPISSLVGVMRASAGGRLIRSLADPSIGEMAQRHQAPRSEEHTSELQSLMRISYAVFCLNKKKNNIHKRPKATKTHKLTNNEKRQA